MTAVSKNVAICKLNEIVDKFNKTYHRTIKMKPTNVNPGTYFEHNEDNTMVM